MRILLFKLISRMQERNNICAVQHNERLKQLDVLRHHLNFLSNMLSLLKRMMVTTMKDVTNDEIKIIIFLQ